MFKKKIESFCVAKLTIVLAIVFLILSCSTIPQMYSGPERHASETALVRGADVSIEIIRIDGRKLNSTAASVLPGDHTAEVTYSGQFYYLIGSMILRWKAEAGHTYVVDKLIGTAPGMSSMFIIDLATKKKVSTGLMKPGEEKDRLKMIETSIKQFPQHAEFWAEKGYLLLRLGRFEDAIAALETALNVKPDMADAWALKSWAFFQQGRYDDSLADIDKTIQFRGNEADKKAREEILKKMEEKKKAQP
jgi:tetratricopeptide (TPR) repeat protein